MAKTTNTQQNKSFENIKGVKSNVLGVAKELQQAAAKARQRANEIALVISQRKALLKQAEAAEQAAAEQATVENIAQPSQSVEEVQAQPAPVVVSEEVAPIVEEPIQTKATEPSASVENEHKTATAKLPQQDKPKAQQQDKSAKKSADKPEQPAKPSKVAEQQQPTVEQPKQDVKATPTVVVTTENGREVKTYTDEKGNVKVRKFLDTSALRRNAAADKKTDPKQQRGQRQGDASKDNRGQGRANDKDGRRPAQGQNSVKPSAKKFVVAEAPRPEPQKNYGNKNKTKEHPDEKRVSSRKNLLTKDFSTDYDEDKVVRRNRNKKSSDTKTVVAPKITNAVITTQEVSIKGLSEKIGISASEIIKQLFKEGVMKTINDTVDFDYAEYIAGLYGVTLELKLEKTAEEIISGASEDDGLENNTKRPPIVTVMGHVDHGKTSLLDAIRNTSVTSGEAGGITQHIGAYTVECNGEPITFIDTPGHAAFTAMRARGAKITDVAIIVVAADDGVMPQTIEAINHAKAADVSIIVAINKMDKPHVDPERVKQQLTEYGLLAEEWGGDTIMVPVSAKSKMGIEQLLESVLLVTEIKELKANPDKKATGTVIEAKLDKGKGPVATILVSNGTLKIGDSVIAGSATGKIRAMFDDKGRKVKSAGPSIPVEVLGFSEVPQAGDFMYVADEKLVKKAAEERKDKIKLENARQAPSMNLGDLFGRISEGQLKNLNIIIKTDVQGSLEALKGSLEKISNDEVKVSAIHGGVGGINETDVILAKASDAIVIGFNVRADSNAKALAEKEGVDIRLYSVIYDAVDDVTAAMKGMLAPKYKETITGSVEVREVFKITGVGAVAGAYVTSGKAVRNGKVRIYRNNISIYDGNINALKRFKDDVKEVAAGYECGISVVNYNDIKVGDVFEIYQVEEIQQ